jgi:hypothetical protein
MNPIDREQMGSSPHTEEPEAVGTFVPLSAAPSQGAVGGVEKIEPRNLAKDMLQILGELKLKYATRIRSRPKAFKRRVMNLVRLLLPPIPRKRGRPQKANITRAANEFVRQQNEIEVGKRQVHNWEAIANTSAGFRHLRSEYARRAELRKLQTAVYARLHRRKK